MSGYKGSATITFYVNRVKDANGKWQVPKPQDDWEELELEVHGTAYFQPGKLYGPPENCYPDEGQSEIESITLDGKPWDGELTDKETERAEEKLDESVREDEGPDPPSRDDFDDYDPPSYDFSDEE